MFEAWFGLSSALFALTAAAMLGAGIVRGYSGFGSSAVVVGTLALATSPARIVPVMYLMEIAASLTLLPAIRRHIDWGWLIPLTIANFIATPIGVAMLARFDERTLRLAVALILLALSVVLLTGGAKHRQRPAGMGLRWAAGGVSGLMNGIAAVGGLSVAALFLLSGTAATEIRATLIALLFLMDLSALGLSFAGGIVHAHTLALFAVMTLPMMAGIRLGHRLFEHEARRHGGDDRFRRRVSWLLLALALAGLTRQALG